MGGCHPGRKIPKSSESRNSQSRAPDQIMPCSVLAKSREHQQLDRGGDWNGNATDATVTVDCSDHADLTTSVKNNSVVPERSSSDSSTNSKAVSFKIEESVCDKAPLAKFESMTVCCSNMHTPDDEYKPFLCRSKLKLALSPLTKDEQSNKNENSYLRQADEVLSKTSSCNLNARMQLPITRDEKSIEPERKSSVEIDSIEQQEIDDTVTNLDSIEQQEMDDTVTNLLPSTSEDCVFGTIENETGGSSVYRVGSVYSERTDLRCSQHVRLLSDGDKPFNFNVDRKFSLPSYSRKSGKWSSSSFRNPATSPACELLVIDEHMYQQLRSEATQLKATLLRLRRLLQQGHVSPSSLRKESEVSWGRFDLLKENKALRERLAILECKEKRPGAF